MKKTEESFPIQLMVQSYGNWALGFAWVNVSIGQGPGARGLALYASLKGGDPKKKVVADLKNAVAFLESCRVPARQSGKFLAAVEKHEDSKGEEAFFTGATPAHAQLSAEQKARASSILHLIVAEVRDYATNADCGDGACGRPICWHCRAVRIIAEVDGKPDPFPGEPKLEPVDASR